ncbi:MAG TPA: hypothetical protein VI588_00035, partial [Candidatus Gracilibacteria bacterium]|nr:hypothetical protein [Candidatus Gracilibacteria bacterium]
MAVIFPYRIFGRAQEQKKNVNDHEQKNEGGNEPRLVADEHINIMHRLENPRRHFLYDEILHIEGEMAEPHAERIGEHHVFTDLQVCQPLRTGGKIRIKKNTLNEGDFKVKKDSQ